MDNDAAHHANIALHMYNTGDYVSLIDHGHDYLDKPHLHFWLAALSYQVFGVTAFAYKLPSLLFSMLAIWSTYRLGKLLYNREAGRLAALILGTSFAFVLANSDVRMDAILSSCIIFSIWQLAEFTESGRWKHLLMGALGLAAGFATKGMIALVVPAIAIFFHLLYQRNWSMLFHRKWLLLPVLVGMFLSPVLYCYYLQFDLHPEKVIRGHQNISGIRFILWSQSLERFEGSAFGGDAKRDPLFFAHTFLWAFLPWSLLWIAALWKKIKRAFRKKLRYAPGQEALTWTTILFVFILISWSGFKLPHYLNILFPLTAVLLGGYLTRPLRKRRVSELLVTQYIVAVLMLTLTAILNLWFFPVRNFWIVLGVPVIVFFYFHARQKTDRLQHTIFLSVCIAILTNFLLNTSFYPQVLTWQAGNTLAEQARDSGMDLNNVFYLEGFEQSNSFDFYTARLTPTIPLPATRSVFIYTGENGMQELEAKKIPFIIREQASDYRVSQLRFRFLDPQSRERTVSKHYLLEVTR
jgi:4-amino-4-deoxy-L-arabinose transferase-like glycosyltransferase